MKIFSAMSTYVYDDFSLLIRFFENKLKVLHY